MTERLDIITRLPQAMVETILCLFPIEEAARTSILSKEWRNQYSMDVVALRPYKIIVKQYKDLQRNCSTSFI
ncbi:putative F-box-like domain superfamily protein [Helianthus annuus]|nr:putative F-box-like domain superfamily protein [Helianthus annuus]KAJ0446941.1 putative F-box-like domain superfamily protein [Helianthus annuus]KAJ0631838.1 putative F-box-like domain superfamily protein [Helianthus annuus]KAJ0635741.1 putative F-box-like domain superfamily protein [Helianthus annuus]KAJ0812516.1 putative F-box-like domain superfamily protein [Helianthus annuus]